MVNAGAATRGAQKSPCAASFSIIVSRVSQKGNGKRRGFSANTLCQLINCIYRAAGIAGATSHSGRRGFITTLANHSVGIKTIMELAGHRQLSNTQRYISVTPEQKRKAVELVS
jgi:integrase/recombinase XerD